MRPRARASTVLLSDSGTSVVEFALVASLFMLIVFGILEGGRVFNSWLIITNEAREAARWGVVRVGDKSYSDLALLADDVEAQVIARTSGLIDQEPAVFNVAANASDEAVSVRIEYLVPVVTPLIAAIRPSFQLVAESTMRSE